MTIGFQTQPPSEGRPRQSERKLAVCGITTRNWTFEQDVRAYAAAGIDALGVYGSKLAAIGIPRALQLLRDSGLPATSFISGKELTGTQERLGQECVDEHLRLLDECLALGVDTLVVVPGNLHGRDPARVEALAIEALRRLAPAAQERGLCLGLEPIRAPYFDFMNTLAHAQKLARAVAHPAVGLVFDTWHLWREPGLSETLVSAIDLIRLVHVSDWREPTREHDDRLLPGDGVMPLAEMLRDLDALGYSGLYEVEIYSKDLWAADYHRLLQHCRRWFDGIWQLDDSRII